MIIGIQKKHFAMIFFLPLVRSPFVKALISGINIENKESHMMKKLAKKEVKDLKQILGGICVAAIDNNYGDGEMSTGT